MQEVHVLYLSVGCFDWFGWCGLPQQHHKKLSCFLRHHARISVPKLAEDFIPSCKKCHAKLLPVLDEQCSCSVCGGRMGPKKCVQFECRGGLELSTCDLFRCEPSKRQAYCGSHPFFGGYSAIEQVHGDAGPALWEEKLDSTEGFEVVMTASRFWEGAGDGYGWHTEAHIFADRLQECTRCVICLCHCMLQQRLTCARILGAPECKFDRMGSRSSRRRR